MSNQNSKNNKKQGKHGRPRIIIGEDIIAEAVKMRQGGKTYREIAKKFGFRYALMYRDVSREIERLKLEDRKSEVVIVDEDVVYDE